MPEITYEESLRQVNDLIRQAEASTKERRYEEAVERWRAVLAHRCAHHQVVVYEVLDEIHQVWRRAGRFEEAIEAKREAIRAGYRSVTDPEADIAEWLVEAGHRDEGDALFAELRTRDPNEVWLYNSAAYTYGNVDEREALRWARDGIEVCAHDRRSRPGGDAAARMRGVQLGEPRRARR